MIALLKPISLALRLPHISFAFTPGKKHRRRQATMDLLAASPHLRRDIGLVEEHFYRRKR